MVSKKYCDRDFCILYGQFYKTIIVNGRTFMQCFEKIYEIRNIEIRYICEIADLPKNNYAKFYGKLFEINDKLYVTNYKQLFMLEKYKLEFVRDTSIG